MAVTSFHAAFPSQQNDVQPRLVRMNTSDDNNTVAIAGYMNPYILSEGYVLLPNDFVFVSASDGNHIYTVSISAGVVTLNQLV